MERQDSVMDDAGFQTYTGRRGSRRDGHLGAYEDKAEVKQTTVEATVDQREILQVFANALPGLEFLAGQAGHRDGQVQFIQHPNGDVSAHMWSMRRYQWDNIGHFSNIRKRIEGQLAGEHLKGETAYQKLRQNTLAYFRTVAKQREAATTGLDFGQAEIQQLLPESGLTKQAAPSSKKLNASVPAFAHSGQGLRLANQEPSKSDSGPQQRSLPQHVEPHSFYAIPQGSRAIENFVQPPPSPKHTRRADDPFTVNSYRPRFTQIGPEFNGGTVAGPARQPGSLRPAAGLELRHSTYGSYNSVPLPTVPDIRMPHKPLPASRTSSTEDVGLSFGSHFHPRFSGQSMPSLIPARVAGTGPGEDRRHLSIASMDSLRGKPVTPSQQAREVMRENLFKISNHAVERSLSREISRENLQNLGTATSERDQSRPPRRTVLHDPFQADEKEVYENYSSSSLSRRSESEPYNSFVPPEPVTAIYHNPDMPIGWIDSQPRKNVPLPLENPLTNSVPDIVDQSYLRSTKRVLPKFYSFNAKPRTSPSMHKSIRKPSMTSDQQLKDWWTSGSTFARQEEAYQRVKPLSEVSSTKEVASGSTFTAANRHCPTLSKPRAPTAGDILMRALIPVCENLASYVTGPERRDYWSPWTQAPEWCIDRNAGGNKSFYEDLSNPQARIGRGSRHQSIEGGIKFAGVAVPASLERRLGYTEW
jgi:hypothetical protein